MTLQSRGSGRLPGRVGKLLHIGATARSPVKPWQLLEGWYIGRAPRMDIHSCIRLCRAPRRWSNGLVTEQTFQEQEQHPTEKQNDEEIDIGNDIHEIINKF